MKSIAHAAPAVDIQAAPKLHKRNVALDRARTFLTLVYQQNGKLFADDGRSMGLVVDEIIDIVEEKLNIEVAGSQDGILGSAVIKGQATEVIDVGHFLPMAFADWFSRKEMRPSASAQSVLLVDDSAFFRNMLAPVLKAAGYKVRTAGGAQEGLAALRSGQAFDVVLTDIEMPEMDGFQVLEQLKADRQLRDLPVIVTSSVEGVTNIVRCIELGAEDFLPKPVNPVLLKARVGATLHRLQLRRQQRERRGDDDVAGDGERHARDRDHAEHVDDEHEHEQREYQREELHAFRAGVAADRRGDGAGQ